MFLNLNPGLPALLGWKMIGLSHLISYFFSYPILFCLFWSAFISIISIKWILSSPTTSPKINKFCTFPETSLTTLDAFYSFSASFNSRVRCIQAGYLQRLIFKCGNIFSSSVQFSSLQPLSQVRLFATLQQLN